MKFSFDIQGLDQVKRALSQLPKEVNDKILYDLHLGAARIVKSDIQSATPEGNNTKKASQKARANVIVKRQRRSTTGVNIGYSTRAFHIGFIEFGTKLRVLKGQGKYRKGTKRGKITARPFIGAAHDRAFPKALQYVSTNYLKLVNRSLKKQLRGLKLS